MHACREETATVPKEPIGTGSSCSYMCIHGVKKCLWSLEGQTEVVTLQQG